MVNAAFLATQKNENEPIKGTINVLFQFRVWYSLLKSTFDGDLHKLGCWLRSDTKREDWILENPIM